MRRISFRSRCAPWPQVQGIAEEALAAAISHNTARAFDY